MSEIKGFHAHVYYDEGSMRKAKMLCEVASSRFPINMGHMHQKPVGPHPMWSCQLAFGPEIFGEVMA